ncbi:MAG: hypothetical protein ACSHX8_12285 [Opitutaceae bacterium]
MTLNCQHCGTRYHEFVGHNGYCCSGCEQVACLIKEGGLADYYALQDRAGRPPELEPELFDRLKWAVDLQAKVEGLPSLPRISIGVSGMSCLGCAWLVEKLAHGQAGIVAVRVELETNIVVIEWIRGEFSLESLLREWARFGYLSDGRQLESVAKLSPLAWRICLCVLFAANGALLAFLPRLGVDQSAYVVLVDLLAWVVAVLGLLVGGTYFLLPSIKSLRMSRLHEDWLSVLAIVLLLWAVVSSEVVELWMVTALIAHMLFSRWVHRMQWRSFEQPVSHVPEWGIMALQCFVGTVLVAGLIVCLVKGAIAGAAVFTAASIYPFARSLRYSPKRSFTFLVFATALFGMWLSYSCSSLLLAMAWLLLSGVSCTYLFLRLANFRQQTIT